MVRGAQSLTKSW